MRLIDADALLDDVMDRYCKECEKRKGIKNGEYRIIYDIGEAPCRACEIDDMKAELEDAPTVDAVPVVRCKECDHYDGGLCRRWKYAHVTNEDSFCSGAERKEE